MPSLVEQLRFSHGNKHLIGKSLSRSVTMAQSIGTFAEQGKQFRISERIKKTFIGTIQVGEYILTGQIPSIQTVSDVLVIGSDEVAQ